MTSSPDPASTNPPTPAEPDQQVLLDQPFEERDLRDLRNAVAAHADHIGLPSDSVGDLILIVSELSSNAVRHGGGNGRLRLWATPTAVYCEVSDDGPGLPQNLTGDRPAPNVSGGRGLWLVLTYADDMIVDNARDGGARVTAQLRRPPATGQ
jgi:anti-sigma regulatory factor (Ser/Thr protein kinase)